MEENETCKFHKAEYLVAIDSDRKNLGCERCVYGGQQKDPKFISLFAREIKDEFDKEYVEFIKNQSGMGDLNPQLIIGNIKEQITSFFETLRKLVDEIEAEVMKKIKESDTLRALAQLISQVNEEYDESLFELIEEEKKVLDDKIEKSKFAFLVLKQGFYKQLCEAMREANNSLSSGIKESKSMYKQILVYEKDDSFIK